jgi:hypothetical protein
MLPDIENSQDTTLQNEFKLRILHNLCRIRVPQSAYGTCALHKNWRSTRTYLHLALAISTSKAFSKNHFIPGPREKKPDWRLGLLARKSWSLFAGEGMNVLLVYYSLWQRTIFAETSKEKRTCWTRNKELWCGVCDAWWTLTTCWRQLSLSMYVQLVTRLCSWFSHRRYHATFQLT